MSSVSAVIVDHRSGDLIEQCIASVRAQGVREIVVVDNDPAPKSADLDIDVDRSVVRPGLNLGYGSGVNRGLAASGGFAVLVSNPDVVVGSGAITTMLDRLEADPTLAIVGPKILKPDGSRYPSARRFPNLVEAVGHALVGLVVKGNVLSGRYLGSELDSSDSPVEVDWVSGACFLARRRALEEIGGFDESYFMYAEDVDLCWRAREAGWGVLYEPGATVTHLQGRSTRNEPVRMMVEHHRSALRFASRSRRGIRRAVLPAVAVALIGRLGVLVVVEVVRRGSRRRR